MAGMGGERIGERLNVEPFRGFESRSLVEGGFGSHWAGLKKVSDSKPKVQKFGISISPRVTGPFFI